MKIFKLIAVVGCFCIPSYGDFIGFGEEVGYMNVYENIEGSQGAYLWGDLWGFDTLVANFTASNTVELLPNVSSYGDGTDTYWVNGEDGNKWLEANVYREHTVVAGDTTATMDFSIGSFDLDSRYSLQAFIRVRDPSANWDVTAVDTYDVYGATATQTLSVGLEGLEGQVVQAGYMLSGLNANPADDWGSATMTTEALMVVPEPAVAALLALPCIAYIFIRRRFMA